MRHPAPVMALLRRTQRENRRLRGDLERSRELNGEAVEAMQLLRANLDRAGERIVDLERRLRDAELLAGWMEHDA